MKKLCTAALSLALAASMTAPALAFQTIMPISAPLRYGYSLTVNGSALDTAKLPFADEGYIPMRLVVESDYGSAQWYAEEGTGVFYMDDLYVSVNFTDNSVLVEDVTLTEPAIVKEGVTFLPVSILENREGYTIAQGEGKIDITTPNNGVLIQLARNISSQIEMGWGAKVKPQELKDNYEVPVEEFTELAAFFPNIISADTIVIGKLKDGADLTAIKTALEAYRQHQEDVFSWYLPQNLERVKKAQTVEKDGYFMFLIAENVDAGLALFHEFVAAQK